jgi:hypothetical protein
VAAHAWRIERQGHVASLAADGETLWRFEVAGALTALAFGEAYVDALHGGEMRLQGVHWRRTRLTVGGSGAR